MRKICSVLFYIAVLLLICSCNSDSVISDTTSDTTVTFTDKDITSVPVSTDMTYETTKPINHININRPQFYEKDNSIYNCELIDKNLDCETILLDRAEALKSLMTDYLNYDINLLKYDLGEKYYSENGYAYEVISDEIKSYDDIKDKFGSKIYLNYLDFICMWYPGLYEIDDTLFYYNSDTVANGTMGHFESWYLGYEVTDYRIIGHFAVIGGDPDTRELDAEYLNNEDNYCFYDIVVQNMNGEYVITDCGNHSDKNNIYYKLHGWLYNNGYIEIDRDLITNEKLKPKS